MNYLKNNYYMDNEKYEDELYEDNQENEDSKELDEDKDENDCVEFDVDYNMGFSSTQVYLNDIRQIPLLTEEEEIRYANELNDARLKIEGISIDDINDKLKRIGYYFGQYNNNTISNLEDRLFFIKNKLVKLRKDNGELVTEEMLYLFKLYDDLDKYCNYVRVINKFMEANLGLVVYWASKYNSKGAEFEDLIQEGNIGLKKAVEKYDVDKGNKFSTYASWWIRQSMVRLLMKQNDFQVPVYVHEIMRKVDKVYNDLSNKLGHRPTDDELIKECNEIAREELIKEGKRKPTEEEIKKKAIITKEKLLLYRDMMQVFVSLSSKIGEDADTELSEVLVVSNETAEDVVVEKEMEFFFRKEVLSMLNKRQLIVVILRYGFDLEQNITKDEFVDALCNDKNNFIERKNLEILYDNIKGDSGIKTLEFIAQMLGVTRERVRQIERTGIRVMSSKVKKLKRFESL